MIFWLLSALIGLCPCTAEGGSGYYREGGLTSHAAIVALNLGIPAIVGVEGATKILRDDGTITVDSMRGLIYRGAASVI